MGSGDAELIFLILKTKYLKPYLFLFDVENNDSKIFYFCIKLLCNF